MNKTIQTTTEHGSQYTYLFNMIGNIMQNDNMLLNEILNQKWKLRPNTKFDKLINNIVKTFNDSKNYWDYMVIINNILEKIHENNNNHILTMRFWCNQRKQLKLMNKLNS